MSQTVAPPIPSLVPDTAPFSDEQRAWLNGFFAGLVSLDGAGVTALSPEQNAALMPGAATELGDGAAGLRAVRLQLRGLFEPHRHEERGAAEPLRAGRQGNRPHSEVALRGARQGASARRKSR